MSHAAEKWARAQTVGNATAKAVLKELAFRLNGKDGLCCPSLKTLCIDLEIKKRDTVLAAVQRLEALGLIAREIERSESGEILRTLYSFPTFVPSEWEDRPKRKVSRKSEQGIPKNGTPYPENRETVSQKSGDRYPENRDVTGNIEQGKEQGIEPSLSPLAPASDELELTPEVEKPTEKEKPKAKKSRRMPQTPCPWEPGTPIPENLKEWAAENYPTIDASHEFEKFVGWMIAKDVRNAKWDQAFRNWMGNALKKAAQRGGNGGSNYRPRRQPTCPGDWEKEFKGVDYTRGAVMKEFTPEESARLATLAEEMNF